MAIKKDQFTISTKHGVYRARIWRDDESRMYIAEASDFPEVVTFGTSLADAKRMIVDAIELHCDCLINERKLIIDDTGRVAGRIPRSRILIPA